MSDLYDRLHRRVQELRDRGVEPDSIVVPGEEWRAVKDAAEVQDGEGTMGGDKTLVNGVRVFHNNPLSEARIRIEVDVDE